MNWMHHRLKIQIKLQDIYSLLLILLDIPLKKNNQTVWTRKMWCFRWCKATTYIFRWIFCMHGHFPCMQVYVPPHALTDICQHIHWSFKAGSFIHSTVMKVSIKLFKYKHATCTGDSFYWQNGNNCEAKDLNVDGQEGKYQAAKVSW